MISAPTPLPQPGLDLSTQTERQATFRQPSTQQETPRQPPAPPPAPPGVTTAARVQASGLRLPALLLPSLPPSTTTATRPQAASLPVELRLALPGGGQAAPGAGAGLVATVVGQTAERGLVLDLAGHRLTVPRGLVDLPVGATLSLQLRLPGGSAFVAEPAGLERLIRAAVDAAPRASGNATPNGVGGALPLIPDARLAVHLLADWRSLAGRAIGAAAPATETAGGPASSLELRVDGESGRSMLLDRDTGWRALFGLLGETGQPVQPLTLWRRERSATPDGEAEERLHLTLDLSRLGRISLDLRTGPGRFWLAIASPEPLPRQLRTPIAEAVAAAAELAGLEPALVFRAAPVAGAPIVEQHREHLTDWVG